MRCQKNAEMKATDRNQVHSLLMFNSTTGLGQLIRCEDYSSLSQLLKVTTYVLKFISILRKNLQSTEPEVNIDS